MIALCTICGHEYEKHGNLKHCEACQEEARRRKEAWHAQQPVCPTGGELRQFIRDCDELNRQMVSLKWGVHPDTVSRWYLKATGEQIKGCGTTRYGRRKIGVADLKKVAEDYAKIDTERAIRAYRAKHRSIAGATRIIPASEIPRGYIA